MDETTPAEPTAEQCSANARLPDVDGRSAYAAWYPQMGGYVGKCVVVLGHPAGDPDERVDVCFDAYVWHDGEFPFTGDVGPPAYLHHCMPSQFIGFGTFVLDRQREARPEPTKPAG